MFNRNGSSQKWVSRNGISRACQSGYQVVQIFGIISIGLMISALAIDFSYYYAANNAIHTAADSAALAAATELYRDPQPDPKVKMNDARAQAQLLLSTNQSNLTLQGVDLIFGFVDPSSKVYNRATFATPTADPNYAATDGYNGVWVKVRKTLDSPNGQLNTIMANLIGIHKMDMEATSIAMVDQTVNRITNGGLRPIYACQAQLSLAMQDGVLENNLVRIYSDHMELDGVESNNGCPTKGSGNWSFADFSGCGSSSGLGASTIRDWFGSGYRETVQAGQCYGTRAGDFLSNMGEEVHSLMAKNTVFPIPLYNSWGGSGTHATVNVSGFVGFKITHYVTTGLPANRYIEGHFSRYFCNTGCHSESSATSKPNGSVVKIRLASRS